MDALLAAAKQFARDDEGITAIEYGLIAAVMAVVAVAAGTALKGPLEATFTSIGTKLTDANTP